MPPTNITAKTTAPVTLNPMTRPLSTTTRGEDEKVVFIIVLFVIAGEVLFTNFFAVERWRDVVNASVVKADSSVVMVGRVVGTGEEGTKTSGRGARWIRPGRRP